MPAIKGRLMQTTVMVLMQISPFDLEDSPCRVNVSGRGDLLRSYENGQLETFPGTDCCQAHWGDLLGLGLPDAFGAGSDQRRSPCATTRTMAAADSLANRLCSRRTRGLPRRTRSWLG